MMLFGQSSAKHSNFRRGSVLPMLALSLVALISFVAMALDVGMLAIARAQAQNAADLAALAAARTLNGSSSSNYNQSAATTNAQTILSYNYVLGNSIQSSQLQLSYGSYDYNQTSQTFNANFPATNGMPLTAVTSTVTSTNASVAFATIFGYQFFPKITTIATAVHRPRDIALTMDLSASMRFGTCLGFDFYPTTRSTNNPDTVYPTFGHYSSNSTSLQGPSTNRASSSQNYTISPSNTSAGNTSYTLTYVNSFMQNAAYANTLIRAFDSFTSSDSGNTWTAPAAGTTPQLPPSTYATTPGGDVPLFKQNSTTVYATNVNDVLGSASTNILWELDGYSAYAAGQPDTSGSGGVPQVWTQADYSTQPFHGYTQGPGYYGLTYFIWPPDPRNANALTGGTLTSFLQALGMNSTDAATLAGNSYWLAWQAQGATGLSNLQKWLTGNSTKGGPYKSTGPFVPGSNNKAAIYYAVCRLFNRAYPGGTAWTSTSFHADWRLRFFGTNNNQVLFNWSGQLNSPGSYTINYAAILSWLTQAVNSSGQSVNPFPTQLRAGRIKYYGSIPTQITGSWPNYGSTDQRFWKETIDYALGFYQTGSNSYQDISGMAGYGSDISWGNSRVNSPPSAPQYMNYTDNPYRPLLRHWFGPMNMVDYMQNCNMGESQVSGYFWMQPGDGYEAPLYSGKQAFLGAISTMQTNNPNDWFAAICYSWPRSSSNGIASGGNNGRFNCVRSPLGPNYAYAQAALVFPFSTINADGSSNNTELTPYTPDPATSSIPSADMVDTPRGDGDTCFDMALMLAYNQFATTSPSDGTLRTFVSSSPITFPTGMAGGLGRRGAQKVVVFETDGIPNCTATASLVNAGTYKYYAIRYDMNNPTGSQYPSVAPYGDLNDPAVLQNIQTYVTQLKTDYGTTRNPFELYAIGFGPVFQGVNNASAQSTLQSMQYWAGTQSSASTPLSSAQIVTGTDAQMTANMISAFTTILQNGVQIALIQ